jgi:hypothetical protein
MTRFDAACKIVVVVWQQHKGQKMLKDITALQWLGIIILFNTTLLGSASQLADLMLPAIAVKAVLAVATIGNGFLGGLVTMFGGAQALKNTVGGMDGGRTMVLTTGASADKAADNPNVVGVPASYVEQIRRQVDGVR